MTRVTPLEINVGETKVAVIIGERPANTHPSVALEWIPSRTTTDHFRYDFVERDDVSARVLVSTRKRHVHARSMQYVAIVVKGADQDQVRQFAENLSERVKLDGVTPSQNAAYFRNIVDYVGGGVKAEIAISALLGVEPRVPEYKW